MIEWNTRLKTIREKNGLTQKDLAKLIEVNEKSIYRYEAGVSEPSLTILIRMAEVLHCSIDYLVGFNKSNTSYKQALKTKLDDITNDLKNIIKNL